MRKKIRGDDRWVNQLLHITSVMQSGSSRPQAQLFAGYMYIVISHVPRCVYTSGYETTMQSPVKRWETHSHDHVDE